MNTTTKNTTNKASPVMKPVGIFLTVAAAITIVSVPHELGRGDSNQADNQFTFAVDPAVESKNASRSTPTVVLGAEATPLAEFNETLPNVPQQQAAGETGTVVGPPLVADRASQVDSDGEQRKAGPVAPRDKMSGPVLALLKEGATGDAELVVRYDQQPALFDDELVNDLGGTVVRSFDHLEMRAIRLPVSSLETLASDSNVDWLSIDDKMSATSVSSRLTANLPGSGSANEGYAGLNVGIAVLDTGVSNHADLGDNIIQYSFLGGAYPTPTIANGVINALNDGARNDHFGHGTHVAGLLSGSGHNSNGAYKGSAQQAKVLSLQVLDANGSGSMSDVMAALDWLLTYAEYFDIRVVNLSLGKGISESNETDPLVLSVERLWDAGIVVVVAAGNDGFSGSMTVNSPGNSRKVITVGSLTDSATGLDASDDYVSSFSSRGPTIGDYVLKPDLLAPGNRVVGTVSAKSNLAKALSSRIKECSAEVCATEDAYLEMSGTSMATPIVSATVALMLEKDSFLSPATVKARLMRSARKIDVDPTEAGAGLLDADSALDDSGVVTGDALSPLMIFDTTNNTVLVEDTAVLWGDDLWGSAYLYNNGINWASGATFTDEAGVTANGYMWTDGGVSAKGYQWTDGGVSAKGYMWTDGVNAKSLLEGDAGTELFLNDDGPAL